MAKHQVFIMAAGKQDSSGSPGVKKRKKQWRYLLGTGKKEEISPGAVVLEKLLQEAREALKGIKKKAEPWMRSWERDAGEWRVLRSARMGGKVTEAVSQQLAG